MKTQEENVQSVQETRTPGRARELKGREGKTATKGSVAPILCTQGTLQKRGMGKGPPQGTKTHRQTTKARAPSERESGERTERKVNASTVAQTKN